MIFRRNGKQNKNSGFTLVEMIVVLVILGILASVAVYSIINYINLTRYNNNQQNAISIFQVAHSSLNHMSEAGTLEDWCKDVIGPKGLTGTGDNGIGTPYEFDSTNTVAGGPVDNMYNEGFFNAFPESVPYSHTGQSAHMRYAVTYTPHPVGDMSLLSTTEKAQTKLIEDLIGKDFSATELFEGIITIEFDIEKSVDTNGNIRLSADVFSVFYDSKRTRWDSIAYDEGELEVNTEKKVPYRDEEYRRSTSFVGYASGRNGSVAVDTVFIPADAEIKETLFTLRNGETLDLTWSAKTGTTPVTGKPDHIHYIFSLYDDDGTPGENKICDLVVNESSILGGIPKPDTAMSGQDSFYDKLKFDKSTFVEGRTASIPINTGSGTIPYTVVYTSETIHNEKGIPITIYRASITDTAKVFVQKGNSTLDYSFNKATDSSRYYNFPITISYEIYEVSGVSISERISYSLSLDAMMSCNLVQYVKSRDNASISKTFDYSINRLINNSNKLLTDKFPRNFYATMTAANDDFGASHSDYNGTTLATLSPIYAERALDDPVYLQSDGSVDGKVSYSYFEHAAMRENGKEYAVVNSYFSDLNAGSFGSKLNIGGDEVAGITCFRHLYNIRMLEGSSVNVCYTIQRNLNWYLSYENAGTKYLSEVVVYSPVSGGTGVTGFSPVPVPTPSDDPSVSSKYYGRVLNVVSFPSIPKLKSGSTLIAGDNTISRLPAGEDKTSVINNVQMRMESFYSGDITSTGGVQNNLTGYGLINVNDGTIINIRANNMTLILSNLASGFTTDDGSTKDLEGINNAISSFINPSNTSIQTATVVGFNTSSPLGGLVGRNNGAVGSDSITDAQKNTVRFSNCIISSMYYDKQDSTWKLYRLSAVSGVVGDNYGGLYGHLESTGHFAYLGWIDVAGTVGYSERHIDALLKVDNSEDNNEAYLNITDVSSVIMGTADSVGGALGYLNVNPSGTHNHLCQNPDGIIDPGAAKAVDSNGVPTFFAVDVTLDENSYILLRSNDDISPKNTNNRPGGIGGAIGRLTNYGDGILSVQVDNSGVIVSTEGFKHADNSSIERHLGGAIGVMNGGDASNVYIKVSNHSNIGTYDRTSANPTIRGYCRTTGGAVGRIRNFYNENGIYTIDVTNDYGVFGNSIQNMNYTGVGGAVGAIANDSSNNIPKYIINCVNNGPVMSINRDPDNVNSVNANDKIGVGGVIGCVRYLGRGSILNCQMKDGTMVKSSGYNAGGVIGVQSDGMGSNNATEQTSITIELTNTPIISLGNNAGGVIGSAIILDHTTITADLDKIPVTATGNNAGGCIGSVNTIEHSSVTADLDTATITASGNNGGGCIGVTSKFGESTQIQAKITGTIKINALSNVGGIAGRMTSSATTGSALKLDFADTTSALEIKTTTPTAADNDNAGGLIGYLNTNNAFQPTITVPSTLKVYVDCHNNAGGLIGKMEATGHDVSTNDLSFALHPTSHIYAYGSNAGGAFGSLSIGTNFNPNISIVGDPELITSGDNAPKITAVTANAGGIIGNLTGKGNISSDLSLSCAGRLGVLSNVIGIKITTTSNLGGCIGNITGNGNDDKSIKLNGDITLSGSIIELSCTDHAGGVIGNCNYVTFNKDITSAASNLSVSTTDSYAGGCIGRINNGKITDTANITYSGAYSIVTGKGNIGGCVGMVTNVGEISGHILHSGDNAHVQGTDDYTGGIIGSLTNSTVKNEAEISFSGKHPVVEGIDYTGGIIGAVSKGNFSNKAAFIFSGIASTVTGNNYTGGVIGHITDSSINNYVKVSYRSNADADTASPSIITGRGENTGGVIGYLYNTGINGSEKTNPLLISYESIGLTGTHSIIIGRSNNTGGIFGQLKKGTSNENVLYSFTGKYAEILGKDANDNWKDNVGGVIGRSDAYCSNAAMEFKPGTECLIEGADSVGGIAGLAWDRYDTNVGNIPKQPKIILNACDLTIRGTGYVGGTLGSSQNNSWYSGSTITVSNNSKLKITSTGSVAGGDLGYLSNGNLGNGTYMTTSCTGNSTIQINGVSAAGGFIGMFDKSGKTNTPHISLTLDDTSTFSINASGSNAGAGGLIGISCDTFGRQDTGNFNLPNASSGKRGVINISAPNGYAGAIIGINRGKFQSKKEVIYVAYINLSDSRAEITNDKDYLFGKRDTGSSEDNFGYSINGSTVAYFK